MIAKCPNCRQVVGFGGYPIVKLMDAGVPVTVNSDDPSYFGGDISDNIAREHRENERG